MREKLSASSLLIIVLALFGLLAVAILLAPAATLAASVLDIPVIMQQAVLPDAGPGDYDAMHDACVRGDGNTMEGEMDRVHPDWRSHHGSGMHMSAGRHMDGSSGWGMMGRGRTAWGMLGSGGMVW